MALKNINSANIVAFANGMKAKVKARFSKLVFPERKQLGLKLDYIKSAKGKVIALAPHALDSTTKRLAIQATQEAGTKMLLFKNEKAVTEQLRQDLMMAEAAKNTMAMQTIENQIFTDLSGLPLGAEVVADIMTGQILSTGLVTIADNGVGLSYDYGVIAGQKTTLLTTSKWSDTTNADPVADINTGLDYVEALSGVRPGSSVCRRKTLNYMKSNAKIKLALNATSRTPSTVELAAYILDQCGITLNVWEDSYTKVALDGTETETKFFPEEIFTLMPDPINQNPVGYTNYGTTPEEANKMAGKSTRDLVMTGDAAGIAVSTFEENEVEVVKASAIMLASGEFINQIYIITVHS